MSSVSPTSGYSTRFLTPLAEHSPMVVFAYDLTSHPFSYLNAAFEKVWHRTRKSSLGDPRFLMRMIHPEDRQHVKEVYQELLEGVILKDLMFRIVLRDRSERWVCVRLVLLENEHLLTGYAEDVTAERQYNDTLKKYSDKKNSILNILSHDLAGPLAMIQSLSKLLTQDVKPDGNQARVQKIIHLIEKSSTQGMHLI